MIGSEPKLRQLFSKAAEYHTRAEQTAYLDVACEGDVALRAQLEELLQAHREAGSFLREPSGTEAATVDQPSASERLGGMIGPYKLLQQIGEGGMGTVFMAEQARPVQRMVALKVIKAGLDSHQVVARFEAERQALAMMDHFNIARVLDAGTTDGGRPYFVMELVRGLPITKYCDDHHLTPRERLELFVPVCQAIQHAHQKGVIHRDIKPSNVMVTLYDGRPVPKVIDFGVAKAMEQKLTQRTLFTQYGAMVGTLEYMSPEQAETSALGVDTRSDIFSLGVLLYELLTGTTPLTRKRLKEAAYGEILRMIREEEPPRPSTRLLDSGEALASISANRHMEPAKLTNLMRGELDWIVMKTLEKDCNRRYETANGFAADVQRYLNDEPVHACPPSKGYRLRKFVRRNRVALATAALLIAMLILGTVVSTWQAFRAIHAERDAIAGWSEEFHQRQQVEQQRNRALEAEKVAKASESEARSVLEFFQEKVLAAARPEGVKGGLGIDASIRAAVDAAEPQIGPAFQDRPLVEASIRSVMGESYRYLSEPALAIRQHERSRHLRLVQLGPDHPDTLTSMANLALVYKDAGKLDLAVPLYELTLEKRKAILRLDHQDTLTSMNNLAMAYKVFGKLELALPLFERTLEKRKGTLGIDHEDTLLSMNNLANAYRDVDKLDLAVPLFKRTLEMRKEKLGPDHADTLTSMNDLATAYQLAHKFDQALALFKESLEKKKAKLGPNHASTLTGMNNLAYAYYVAGKLDQALPLWEKTLELQKAKFGPDHPNTLTFANNLANVYRAVGKLDQSQSLLQETLERVKAKFGPTHPNTLAVTTSLAQTYQAAGKHGKALPLFEETFEKQSARYGPEHFGTLTSRNNLAWFLATCTDPKFRDSGRAVELAKKALQMAPKRDVFWKTLGVAHYRAGDWKSAVVALEKSSELRKGGDANDGFFLAMTQWQLGKKEEARQCYDRAVAWMEKNKPKDDDLRHLRAEAAELLKIESQPKPLPKSK